MIAQFGARFDLAPVQYLDNRVLLQIVHPAPTTESEKIPVGPSLAHLSVKANEEGVGAVFGAQPSKEMLSRSNRSAIFWVAPRWGDNAGLDRGLYNIVVTDVILKGGFTLPDRNESTVAEPVPTTTHRYFISEYRKDSSPQS